MPAPYCSLSPDNSGDGATAGVSPSETGPLPATRGNFVGYFGPELVNELRDSAASGDALALMNNGAQPKSRNVGLWLLLAALLYVGTRD